MIKYKQDQDRMSQISNSTFAHSQFSKKLQTKGKRKNTNLPSLAYNDNQHQNPNFDASSTKASQANPNFDGGAHRSNNPSMSQYDYNSV